MKRVTKDLYRIPLNLVPASRPIQEQVYRDIWRMGRTEMTPFTTQLGQWIFWNARYDPSQNQERQ